MKASKGLKFEDTLASVENVRQQTTDHRSGYSLKQLNWHNYEKIRVVGKGAFGTAVLYRKKADGLLVVLKEINMNELNASERQLAINEAKVLSIVNHPNIISYYDSYESNGDLYIEMEYADAGTLAEFLSHLTTPLSEFEILLIFRQIVCAISYLHQNNILHRDIKTANIFLNKEGYIKLGDFGISKLLTTKREAESVVGTPYYISPEICEGKSYDQKSDVWALGCVLYEMACLQKTFEGSNLPVLINKIVKGQFQPIKQNYSNQFRNLITELLQKDPESRPTAQEVELKLMRLLSKLQMDRIQFWNRHKEMPTSIMTSGILLQNSSSMRYPHSIVYRVHIDEPHLKLSPLSLPPGVRVKEINKSSTHGLVLTYDGLVFSWGIGANGQLGLGQLFTQTIQKPKCIETLRNRSIVHVCCGQGFSVFVSKNGLVMTCGDYRSGCLGRPDTESSFTPKLVNALLSSDVSRVSCGTNHVCVVTGDGKAFSWGDNTYGKLGINSSQGFSEVPTNVIFPEGVIIKNVFCGPDCTAFVDNSGSVWVCGKNEFNKLGLNEKINFRTIKVSHKTIATKLKWIRHRVHSVSLATTHSTFLTESGQLITAGNNKEAQLGLGHARQSSTPRMVKHLARQSIYKVQSGSSFTIALNCENVIYFWGARHLNPMSSTIGLALIKPIFVELVFIDSEDNENRLSNQTTEAIKLGECNQSLMNVIETIGPDYPILQIRDPKIIIDNLSDLSLLSATNKAIILKPQPIVSLYASPVNLHQGDVVGITNLYVFKDDSIYIVIDTTILGINGENCSRIQQTMNMSTMDEEEDLGLKNTDLLEKESMDFGSNIPEWIQKEIEDNNSFIGLDVRKAESLPLVLTNKTIKCQCLRHCHNCHQELNDLRNQVIAKNNTIRALQSQLKELREQNIRLKQIEEQFVHNKSVIWKNCCNIQ